MTSSSSSRACCLTYSLDTSGCAKAYSMLRRSTLSTHSATSSPKSRATTIEPNGSGSDTLRSHSKPKSATSSKLRSAYTNLPSWISTPASNSPLSTASAISLKRRGVRCLISGNSLPTKALAVVCSPGMAICCNGSRSPLRRTKSGPLPRPNAEPLSSNA